MAKLIVNVVVTKHLVYRLYKEEGLALKKRPQRKRKALRHREERFIRVGDCSHRCYSFAMPGTYTLVAIPLLFTEGKDKGLLSAVTFIASSSDGSRKYWSLNTFTLPDDFMWMVPAPLAKEFVNRLSKGQTVYFPGFHKIEELRQRFGAAKDE